MKKLLTLFLITLISTTFAQQRLIAVKGAVTDAIAYTLKQAIDIAQPNDKIYLPGGFFEYSGENDIIGKPLHIIGTGFQDGLNVMGRTTINGNLKMGNLANGSTFEGLYLTDWFIPNGAMDNITFKRCSMRGTYPVTSCNFSNSNFINCVVRETLHIGEVGLFGQSNFISNCFVAGTIYRAQYSTIENCIIRWISGCDNIFVKNNVFFKEDPYLFDATSNIVMLNNLIQTGYSPTAFLYNGSTISSEINSIPYTNLAAVFINATNTDFNPTFNFHLTSAFSNTNIGIYGGTYPWKDGSLPIIPNIEKNESYLDVLNQQFKLKVKVVPQTH